jgi:hypothetical protein
MTGTQARPERIVADARTVVRPGDPGIDARWLRRRMAGVALSAGWLPLATLAIGAMTASRIGPPGWIEAWQLRTTGMANPLFAALPLMPLVFATRLAGLLQANERRPFILGMQQAWNPRAVPRLEMPDNHIDRRTRRTYAISLTVMAVGLVALAASVAWVWTNSTRPPATPVPVSYDDVVAGRAPRGLVVVGGVRDGASRWIESTHLRTTTVYDEWHDLPRADAPAPAALVERIALDVGPDGRAREFVRPGLFGRVEPLDDWHADLLRREGFALAAHPWQLTRSISVGTDGMDDDDGGFVLGMFGLVATFLGGTFAFACRRRLRTASAPADAGTPTRSRRAPDHGSRPRHGGRSAPPPIGRGLHLQARYDRLGGGARAVLWVASLALIAFHGVGAATTILVFYLECGRVRGT